MILDVSKIINDKIKEMDESGEIKAFIENETEKSVKEALSRFITGYKLKDAVEEECGKYIGEIAKEMGLESYTSLIAQTAAKVVEASIEGDAQVKIREAIEGMVLKKRDKIKLSEIVSEWRKHIDTDDEEEKRDRNEDNDGFLCVLKRRNRYSGSHFEYYTLLLDEEGDKDTNDLEDIEIAVRFDSLWTGGNGNSVRIDNIFFRGSKLSKEFVHHTPDRFEQLLMNLYLNKTKVEFDKDSIDWDDHYYDTEKY